MRACRRHAALRPENVLQLEAQGNKLLVADLPKELFEARRDVAIDFHDLPCYGRVSDSDGRLCRGQARCGTTHFVRIAAAYVMQDGLRFTLAERFVRPTHQIQTSSRGCRSTCRRRASAACPFSRRIVRCSACSD